MTLITSSSIYLKSQPSGGFGNFILLLLIASRKIHVSGALSSHPAHTNMNCMSKLQAVMTFCVGTHFLSINKI
jgi:hypothetical protein